MSFLGLLHIFCFPIAGIFFWNCFDWENINEKPVQKITAYFLLCLFVIFYFYQLYKFYKMDSIYYSYLIKYTLPSFILGVITTIIMSKTAIKK